MSKKLFYIKVVIVSLFIIIVCMFILVLKNIQQSSKIKETVVEETIKEEKIVFNMKLPPNKQKNLKGHVREYMSQVYDYLYNDIKWKNIKNPFPYPYSKLKEKDDVQLFYKLLKMSTMYSLINILFDFDNVKRFDDVYIDYPLNMDDLPVTENYKKKHPKPLYEEFDTIIKKKEDYKHPKIYHGEAFDYWYEFNYDYGVGVVEENKEVCVIETKTASRFIIENSFEIHAPVYDKDRNEVPPDINTMNIYFKYTTDEKGYVDDVVYDRTEIITDDKYLDSIIKYDLSTTD